ncbi:MAG: tryptophan--tRNA ligase [Chitinophagales bacterium]
MERVLSGIQPTSEIHLGNYFGAVKNWVDLQERYECFFGVVDYHAMTMPYEPAKLYENTWQMCFDLIACGVDPEKCKFFIQSLVPEHAELAWILSCFTSYGELSRMTQFKDKSESDKVQEEGAIVSAGLFTYPILQAADILVYRAKYVPVGKDQEQHLELSRNIAVRFNNKHGEFFTEPQALFTQTPKLLSLADPEKKMSKSLGDKHVVRLFEEADSVRKKVKSAVTDTGNTPQGQMSAGVSNLFELLKACNKMDDYNNLMNDYKSGGLRYVSLKEKVGDALIELTSGFIEKRKELMADRKKLEDQIYASSERARAVAQENIRLVRELTGLPARKN